jgi:hypothetical protein
MASMVFAHQGGWDEIVFALTPLVIVAALLRLANRRANAARTAAARAAAADEPRADPLEH